MRVSSITHLMMVRHVANRNSKILINVAHNVISISACGDIMYMVGDALNKRRILACELGVSVLV